MLPSSPIVSWLLTYRYAIVYPLTIVQGPIVMLIGGFLVRLGFFSFWPIYLTIVAADLTGDVLWYYVGHHGARKIINKYGRFIGITEENVERAEKFFHEHQGKILFISKLTTGFGLAIAVLIAAGAARVPFRKYLTINFFGEFVWAGALMGIGFFFGHLYTLVDRSLHWAFIIGLVIIVAGVAYGFSKFVRTKFNP